MFAQMVNGRLRLHEIENRVLRTMTGDQLVAELQRVERELRFWRNNARGRPAWYRGIPEVRAERNCLQSARQRIERELRLRTQALAAQHVAANELALDGAEIRQEMAG